MGRQAEADEQTVGLAVTIRKDDRDRDDTVVIHGTYESFVATVEALSALLPQVEESPATDEVATAVTFIKMLRRVRDRTDTPTYWEGGRGS